MGRLIAVTPEMVLDVISSELETDTNWTTVNEKVEQFEKLGGYDSTEASTRFQIFTKLLGVTKDSIGVTKWTEIKDRYYASRKRRELELRDEGLSNYAIGDAVGVSEGQVRYDMRNHDKNVTHPRVVYQISNYTKPETAAGKLVAKFGHEWCRDLINALKGQLDD